MFGDYLQNFGLNFPVDSQGGIFSANVGPAQTDTTGISPQATAPATPPAAGGTGATPTAPTQSPLGSPLQTASAPAAGVNSPFGKPAT